MNYFNNIKSHRSLAKWGLICCGGRWWWWIGGLIGPFAPSPSGRTINGKHHHLSPLREFILLVISYYFSPTLLNYMYYVNEQQLSPPLRPPSPAHLLGFKLSMSSFCDCHKVRSPAKEPTYAAGCCCRVRGGCGHYFKYTTNI